MNQAWLEAETARRYQQFTQQTTMYQALSQVMVKLAKLKAGLTILDLGCGTGVTTKTALPYLRKEGQVIAIDISASMLEQAQANLSSPQITFIQADAANFVHLIGNVTVDCILCNSVFWQFRHKTQVMEQLQQILKPNGLFVFNLPEPYFIFQNIPRSKKVGILFKQLVAERYGVGPQDMRTLAVFLEQYQFKVIHQHEITRTRTATENFLFLQIPVTTAWMEPPLDYQTRMAILEEAKQQAEPDKPAKRRWIYIVAQNQANR